MRYLLLNVLLSGILSPAIAQTVNPDAILEKTSQIYQEWGGMEVKYAAHIFYERNATSESFEGTIRMKNDKFVLTRPDMKTWFDGTTQWTLIHEDEVNIITPTDEDLRFINPMRLLQNYKKDFNVSFIGESTSANAKSAFDIALIPKKKEEVEKIEIQIEKNTSLPVKLVVTVRNQIRLTVAINGMKADNPFDEIFTFPKASYPDVEMIDLR
jgi:outer membrane lipoprotein-sorting protein